MFRGMNLLTRTNGLLLCLSALFVALVATPLAQLIDKTLSPNNANEGIAKSLDQEIGNGRGSNDFTDANASLFIIHRDPFRGIRRGRQLFQRKFTRSQGQGPVTDDGAGNINTILAIGAGLSDSCAGCHGRPRGSAGAGGDVVTRPDSRDAPHLFGLGLKEMLADEITTDLRHIRALALTQARAHGRTVTMALTSKGISYGSITATASGTVFTDQVEGVDPDLRVRPFFAHGGTISIREFAAGALNNEMGMSVDDADLDAAIAGQRVVTPSGMVLDGTQDAIEGPPGAPVFDIVQPQSTALLDYLEFYLLNYFKPAVYQQTTQTQSGSQAFDAIGCTECHKPSLTIQHDRRVADVQTVYNPANGIFNTLFATATPSVNTINDGHTPPLNQPIGGSFVVNNIYTDLKRHDLGPNFHERNYDGTTRTQFMTLPLWGVGSTAPYGHDGRSINLTEVIRRHGGEAQAARDAFVGLSISDQTAVLAFLNSLVLFPPDDTASNLDPGNPSTPGFPQFGHGSIKLTVLFNDPANKE